MREDRSKKTVVVCDTQPITGEGLRTLLTAAGDMEFLASLNSLETASQLVTARTPDVVILDKGFGMLIVLDWIHHLNLSDAVPAVVVWGVSMTEAEALRLLQAGAQGIVRKTADLESILSCLRAVAAGQCWTEDSWFSGLARGEHFSRAELTPRQQQVLEMVEQGFKNKEIALELGIRPGTVKIHLKHIFIRTGVRGRYSLAMSVLKHRGLVSMAS
jgi:two-component system, NarL family, nitrate/nitrite response regulator NarL